MSHNDCERYSPQKRDEIAARWQSVERPKTIFLGPPTGRQIAQMIWAAYHSGDMKIIGEQVAWLDACLHAPNDVQILLEWIATMETEVAELRRTLDEGFGDPDLGGGRVVLRERRIFK